MPNAEEEGTGHITWEKSNISNKRILEGESEEHGEGTDFFAEGSKKTAPKTQAGEDKKSQEEDEVRIMD